MSGWIALLRAVNVGGSNKLPMTELKVLCEDLGLARVQTYIASGNVVFSSALGEDELREAIEAAIERRYGKRIAVLVRSGAEMAGVLARNPWPERAGNRVMALIVDGPVSLEGVKGQVGEVLEAGEREIFIGYPEGMAATRLVVPAAAYGTMRNMNTVARLAELAAKVE